MYFWDIYIYIYIYIKANNKDKYRVEAKWDKMNKAFAIIFI